MGEFSPNGYKNSIFVFGSSTKDHRDAVIRFILRRADLGAKRIAVLRRRRIKIRDGDGDVVQASNHGASNSLLERDLIKQHQISPLAPAEI